MMCGRAILTGLFATALLGGSVAMAEQPTKPQQVSCTKVSQEIKAGKTEEQVAKDLKVPLEQVKRCLKPGQSK